MTIHEWRVWVRTKLYIPFSVFTAVITVVALSLVQSVERRPTFITFAVATSAWLCVVFVETLAVIADEWQEWFVTSVAKRPPTRRRTPRLSRASAVLAIVDMYFALCGAHALVAMTPWLFDESADKALYYTGFEHAAVGAIHERDPWLVYFHFLSVSVWLYNSAGFGRVQPLVWWLTLFYTVLSIVGYLYGAVIVTLLFDAILLHRSSSSSTHYDAIASGEYGGAGGATFSEDYADVAEQGGAFAMHHHHQQQQQAFLQHQSGGGVGGYNPQSMGANSSLIIGGATAATAGADQYYATGQLLSPQQQQFQHLGGGSVNMAPTRLHHYVATTSGGADYATGQRRT